MGKNGCQSYHLFLLMTVWIKRFGGGPMSNLYTPDCSAEAAVSKDSILLQMTSLYRQTNRCLPIVWSRLVLPILKARMKDKTVQRVTCSDQELDDELKTVIHDPVARLAAMRLLQRYDYIRVSPGGRWTAGTRLWQEVDARRMMEALAGQQATDGRAH